MWGVGNTPREVTPLLLSVPLPASRQTRGPCCKAKPIFPFLAFSSVFTRLPLPFSQFFLGGGWESAPSLWLSQAGQ